MDAFECFLCGGDADDSLEVVGLETGLQAGPWPNFGFQFLGHGGSDICADDWLGFDVLRIGLDIFLGVSGLHTRPILNFGFFGHGRRVIEWNG